LAQIADEDKPMPSDEDVARQHRLPDTEAEALVRFARAVSKNGVANDTTARAQERRLHVFQPISGTT
jgi:hypothetical protein